MIIVVDYSKNYDKKQRVKYIVPNLVIIILVSSLFDVTITEN